MRAEILSINLTRASCSYSVFGWVRLYRLNLLR